MKKQKGGQSLFARIAVRNAGILFLTNLVLLLGTLGFMTLRTVSRETQRLQSMVTLISDRVAHVGTPSRMAFADVTLRDGLEFAVYDEYMQPVYLSSYSMPKPSKVFYDVRIDMLNHIDYTTFADETRKKDLMVHVWRKVDVFGTTYLLYVVSDISALLELLASLPMMLVIEVLLCLVFSVLLGRWLSGQALQPVRAISTQIASKTADNHNLFERIDEDSVDEEFRELVRAFNQMMQQLEVSFARQRQFVSDASHELRTPIAVLQGHIQMLDRWGKDDPEVLNESLGVLKREIAELKEMVHRLLLLDKAEQGRIEVKRETFDVAAVLEQAKEDQLLISPKSLIEVSAEKGAAFVGDRTILQQVLRILLDNSVRYCPPPGQIRLSARIDDDGLCVEVYDEGKGISADALPYIFDRFYRAECVRPDASGNSGLGLSIARSLLGACGGWIDAQSEEGKYTRMEFFMPVMTEEKTEE